MYFNMEHLSSTHSVTQDPSYNRYAEMTHHQIQIQIFHYDIKYRLCTWGEKILFSHLKACNVTFDTPSNSLKYVCTFMAGIVVCNGSNRIARGMPHSSKSLRSTSTRCCTSRGILRGEVERESPPWIGICCIRDPAGFWTSGTSGRQGRQDRRHRGWPMIEVAVSVKRRGRLSTLKTECTRRWRRRLRHSLFIY